MVKPWRPRLCAESVTIGDDNQREKMIFFL